MFVLYLNDHFNAIHDRFALKIHPAAIIWRGTPGLGIT